MAVNKDRKFRAGGLKNAFNLKQYLFFYIQQTHQCYHNSAKTKSLKKKKKK